MLRKLLCVLSDRLHQYIIGDSGGKPGCQLSLRVALREDICMPPIMWLAETGLSGNAAVSQSWQPFFGGQFG